jgi:two-component system, OmpR family, sensor histidine kinase BaeS
VVAVPAEDITSAWARLLPRLLLAGGGAGVVAVIFATLFASRITNPLAQMTRASQAMARGDLNQRIAADGRDEVGRLAQAFNLMSERVSRSDRSMRELLANVSHELKTPLTSIQGFSQALVDGIADDPEEIGALINEEANRIRVLVDDLLYLSEIESGTLRMELEDVDIDAVAESTIRRFRFPAEDAGVELAPDLAGCAVRADGRRLEQILANLLDNALRFTPRGEMVTLRTRAQSDGVLIEVHNPGPPIPEEHAARIFDRFYQADPARAGARHRGLGLSIVQELVQAHGGSVTVDSAEHRGTTFSIFLPATGPRSTQRSAVAAAAEERV